MVNQDKDLKQILFAEDDPDIRAMVELTFSAMTDIDLVACCDGLEAKTKAAQLRPDMLLLDVVMPEMDGPTVFQHVKKLESCKNIPVVLMTAKVSGDDLQKYKKLGVTGVITKPFNPADLPGLVTAFWRDFQKQAQ